jgi:subtilisin family serine protease
VKLVDNLSVSDVHRFSEYFAHVHSAHLLFVYDSVLPGFAVSGLSETAAQAISRNPMVDFVEEDAEVNPASATQLNPPWHLDRLDQRTLPLDNVYRYDCSPARDVVVYVIDSGVLASHTEFMTSGTSRVLAGADFSGANGSETNPCSSYTCTTSDPTCTGPGHGTAVASIIAGNSYGVAKLAKIIPVRIFGCNTSAPYSTLMAALNWVSNDRATRAEVGIVNMSLEGPASYCDPGTGGTCASDIESAIDNLVSQKNVSVVVAAGNQNADVLGSTPARHSHANGGTAITVGGSNNSDHRWVCNPLNSWETILDISGNPTCGSDLGSNWGGVDIFAPSQNIQSAGLRDINGSASNVSERASLKSGTSFSSPIVAGLAARYVQTTGVLNPTPANVWNYVLWTASGDSPSTPPGVMLDATGGDPNSGTLNGSPNRLVFGYHQTPCQP